MDYFDLIRDLLVAEKSSRNFHDELVLLVKMMHEELQHSQETVGSLQKQMKQLTTSEGFNVTSMYIILQGETAALKSEIVTLKGEIDDLNIQMVAEREDLKQKHQDEKQAITDRYANELRYTRASLDDVNRESRKREQELLNEIQVLQASSALEMDEMESRLKVQLNETTSKLRDAIKTSTTLRTELMHLKDEYAMERNETKQRILDLKRSLEYSQEQLKLLKTRSDITNSCTEQQPAQQQLSTLRIRKDKELQASEKPDKSIPDKKTSPVITNKYEPLLQPDSSSSATTAGFSGVPSMMNKNSRTFTIGSSSSKFSRLSTTVKNPPVPPLIELKLHHSNRSGGDVKNDKDSKKKRKLYNPDDTSHLESSKP